MKGRFDNDYDNDRALRATVLGPWPILVGEGNSLNAQNNWSRHSARMKSVMKNPGCCLFGRVCLEWLLWCSGGSTLD